MMTEEEAKELNDRMWVPTKAQSIDQLADAAYQEEKSGNVNFWTIPDDDPEVIYWKAVWKKGYKKGLEAMQPA
jgi:hypothetical protein